MNILRRIAIILLGLGFGLLLYLNVALIAFIYTFGQPTVVKKALKDSGAYSHVFESILKQAAANPNAEKGIPVDNPVVKQAAAAGANDWQKVAENFVDGTYHWLEGKTPKPDFVINFSDVQSSFAKNLGDGTVQHLKSLPACPSDNKEKFDPLSATCLPAGVNAELLGAQIQKAVAGGEGFKEPLTADSFDKNNSGKKPTFERLAWIPKLYQSRHLLIAASLIGTVLTAFLIFVVSPDHLKGLRRVAHSLLVTGILLIVSVVLVDLLGAGSKNIAGQSQPIVNDVLLPIVTTINRYMNKIVLIIGGVYSAVAVGIYMYLKRVQPKTASKPAMKKA